MTPGGTIIALVASLILAGCASFEVQHVPPGEDQPTVIIKSSAYGRGCVAVDASSDGMVSVIIAQDGTSDWSISRLVGLIGEVAGSVFGANTMPSHLQGPDAAQGCASVLVDEPDDGASAGTVEAK